jgi:hypothetical protein
VALPSRFFYNAIRYYDYLRREQSANFDPLKWTVSFFVYLPSNFQSSYATMWGVFPAPNDSNSEMDIEFGNNNFYSIGLWRYNVGTGTTDTTNYFDLGGNVPTETLVSFVFHWDSANENPDERFRCYMDGVQMPPLSGNWDEIPQNDVAYGDTYTDPVHLILSYGESTSYVGWMSMARVIYVPGQNVDPEFLAAGGVPGTFPAGGYWLEFGSSATLEEDSSGNNNDFTLINSSAREALWWEVHLPEFTWSATGGLVLGGATAFAGSFEPSATGGLLLGGAANVESQLSFGIVGAGGVFFGGEAAISGVFSPPTGGGLLLGGAADSEVTYFYEAVAVGGVSLGGAAGVETAFFPESDGGVALGGGGLYRGGFYEIGVEGSGGVRWGGQAPGILYDAIRDWLFYDMRIDLAVPFTLGIVPAVTFDGAIQPIASFTLPIIGQQEVI